jgi:hypothetical protein
LAEPVAFRYPAGGDTALFPRGKVSLLVYVPHWCFMNTEHLWGNRCMPPLVTRLQRWRAQYGAAGLVITVMARESGQALMNGPLTPSQEADTLAWYLRDYLRAPATVVLKGHPAIQPGARADQNATVVGLSYRDWREGNETPIALELRDRTGQLVYTGEWNAELETYMEDPVFDPVLRRVMIPSSASGATLVAPPSSGAPVTPTSIVHAAPPRSQ